MKNAFRAISRLFFDTVGGVAVSGLLVCAVSGIVLALPYRVNEAFDSVSLILTDNPWAAFTRNIHYWSAQVFFIFSILHIIDHLIESNEFSVKKGIWLRLTFSLPVIFFVMISGFMLKGDTDSLSAFMIMGSLLEKIPMAGDVIKGIITGTGDHLELVYVHHIATATIIIFVVLLEHARKPWPTAGGFLFATGIILTISFFLHAPFGLETGKGPWYFVGYQEILHWFRHPGWTWVFPLLFLGLFFYLPRISPVHNHRVKNLLLFALFIYIILTITGFFFRDEEWRLKLPYSSGTENGIGVAVSPFNLSVPEDHNYTGTIPLVNGKREACLVCHDNVRGMGISHDPEAMGCYSCHKGNPLTLDKNQAHKGMVLIPGNMANAEESCGTGNCHPGIPERVNRSIMTTMSGVVTVDRFVFGENHDLSAMAHIKGIGHSPADQHLRDLCANCHLGNEKTEYGPVTQLTRGGGCNACHLNYSEDAVRSLKLIDSMQDDSVFFHPSLDLKISDDHCFGCHSRSGRIATNYEGWHETLLQESEIPTTGTFRKLEDGRVFEFRGEDVHHKSGLECIDCHISVELMGDGHLYAHKEDQLKVTCEDCHFTGIAASLPLDSLDSESLKIVKLRKWDEKGKAFLKTKTGGYPLPNAWLDLNGKPVLASKNGDTTYQLRSPLEVCTGGDAHSALSCESCHTSWVPQCLGCHNRFDQQAKGFDMLAYNEKMGSWVEYVGVFKAGKPALGIREDSLGERAVITFTPGMILTVDKGTFPGSEGVPEEMIFKRLYAPVSAHTITRQGRDCRSCHLDPLAIGYGRGDLVYGNSNGKGTWKFVPAFSPGRHDSLPEDAWIGFLSEPSGISSTRANTRPFNLREQKKILTAGACLTCHPENSKIMQESLYDFQSLIDRRSSKCVMPTWE